MNTENLNKWLTLSANLGVIAGIVFVAFELRQNSELMRAQISMDRSSVARQEFYEIANNDYLLAIDVKLRSEVEDFPLATGWSELLTAEERRRYQFLVIARSAELRNDWYLCTIGLVDIDTCRMEVRYRMRRNLYRFYELGIDMRRAEPGYLAEMQSLAREEGLPEIQDDGAWSNP